MLILSFTSKPVRHGLGCREQRDEALASPFRKIVATPYGQVDAERYCARNVSLRSRSIPSLLLSCGVQARSWTET